MALAELLLKYPSRVAGTKAGDLAFFDERIEKGLSETEASSARILHMDYGEAIAVLELAKGEFDSRRVGHRT